MKISPEELHTLETIKSDEYSLDQTTAYDKDSYLKILCYAKYLQIALILVSFIFGCVITPLAFESGDNEEINTFWLLTVLLGAHLFSLFLWLMFQLKKPVPTASETTWFTALLKRVVNLTGAHNQSFQCYVRLHFSQATGRWYLGRVVHSAWMGYLIGGLLSALLFLMTHQVTFVWETTLLTATDFQSLTKLIGTLPSLIGIPTPSVEDIATSQINSTFQSDETRKTWAVWILSCVFIYGVMVRLLCTVICHVLYRKKRNDLWQQLVQSRPKTYHSTREIIDENHHDTAVSRTNITPLDALSVAAFPSDSSYFLFEWSRVAPSIVASNNAIVPLNDNVAQQRYLEDSNNDRIIVIDAEASPDRGSLRFMRNADSVTRSFYLHGNRFAHAWSQALQENGIAAEKVAHIKVQSEDSL